MLIRRRNNGDARVYKSWSGIPLSGNRTRWTNYAVSPRSDNFTLRNRAKKQRAIFPFSFFFFARVTFPRRERNERNNLAGSIRDIDGFRSNKRFVRGEKKKKEGEEGFLRVTFRSIRMEEKEEEKGSRKARDNGGWYSDYR